MKSIYKFFLAMSVTFQDESKTSLDSSRDLHESCGGNFVIRLYLILLISDQR